MPKPILTMDCETYRNYFLIQFYNPVSEKLTYFELTDSLRCNGVKANDLAPQTDRQEDMAKVRAILRQYRIVTFNGINYDLPLVALYLKNGTDCAKLKEASDLIIQTGLKYWRIEQRYGVVSQPRSLEHVDLIEVAPGKASLKLYGGRMHCKKLQDLPIEPDQEIAPEQRETLRDYCANDLRITWALYQKLTPQIELREQMSKEYGIDLKSKSDAQIAEAVISKAIEKETKRKPQRVDVPAGTVFKYTPPVFIRFETPVMNEVLSRMVNAEYRLSEGGKIIMPKELSETVRFGENEYRTGIGGCHSSEENISYVSNNAVSLRDFDAQSYYPAIILNCGLYPEHLGKIFLEVYRKLVNDRLAAKKSGDKVKADALKITTNGSFGKFGSKYSFLFSPQLLLQTTLTGQLALLMLVEWFERSNVAHVISVNTDGCTIEGMNRHPEVIKNIVGEWEKQTGFLTEETNYKSLHSQSVNSYIAIKTDGKVKSKGAYTPAGLQKNPTCEICIDAVIEYLKSKTPVEQTIRQSRDFTKFVAVRKVTGGAVYNGEYLGRVVRFYYRENSPGAIYYKVNDHLVPKTEGAVPCMELPDDFPQDIDYNHYVNEAEQMLRDIGERLW